MNPAPPDPRPPLLDPQTLRVVLVGGSLFVAVLAIDAVLEITGHGGSPIAGLVTKVIAAVVGVGTTYLAGRGPGPKEAAMVKQIAHLEKVVADSVPPPKP